MSPKRVLTELDEYPRHQTIDTFDIIANPSPGWSDGYWHCIGDPGRRGQPDHGAAALPQHEHHRRLLDPEHGRREAVQRARDAPPAARHRRPDGGAVLAGDHPGAEDAAAGAGGDERRLLVRHPLGEFSAAVRRVSRHQDVPGRQDGGGSARTSCSSGGSRAGSRWAARSTASMWTTAGWGRRTTPGGRRTPARASSRTATRHRRWSDGRSGASRGRRWWALVRFPDRSMYCSFRHHTDGTIVASGTGGGNLPEYGRVHSRIDYPYDSGKEGWGVHGR